MSESSFGFTSTNSTSKNVNFVAFDKESPDAVVGRLVYFDIDVNGEIYRSIGTVTSMLTENGLFSSGFEMASSRGLGSEVQSKDVRKSSIDIQAVFKKDEEGVWQQHGSALPTSPNTRARVELLTDETVAEMLQGADYPTLGKFRGLKTANVPLSIPNFDSNRGAVHQIILGRSGGGKQLDVNTPVPTPSGWTTMGQLKEGDKIFDEQGNICKVLVAHPIEKAENSYEVVFSDGSKILADARHLWYTETEASRKSASASRNTSKRVNTSRKTLLSKREISHVRYLASEVPSNAVLSVPEAWRNVGRKSVPTPIWMYTIAKTLQPVSYQTVVEVKGYQTQAFKTRAYSMVYPKKQMLQYFINNQNDITRMVKNSSIATKISTMLANTDETDMISMRELRELFGTSARSGSFAKIVQSSNITGSRVLLEIDNKGATYRPTFAKPASEVPQYNAKEFLHKIAEYGSRVINDQRDKIIVGSVKTTQEILDTLIYETESRKTWNHSVPVAKPIKLSEKKLPIHPYTLGAYLGDGHSHTGAISGVDEEIRDYIIANDRNVTSTYIHDGPKRNIPLQTWTFDGLKKDLNNLGILLKPKETVRDNGSPKRIPRQYLRASENQRRELLAGLMDTDGNATKSAKVQFTSIYKQLADDVYELVLSLGYRATMKEKDAKLNGKFISKKYVISWSTSDDVFKLTRKVETHRKYAANYNENKNNQRYIVAVNKIEPMLMRCITVDSPNALYLAGRNFIPTHNTAMAAMLLSAYMSHENHAIFVIDPQGQWSNENGIPFSPQKFARGLGRNVTVLRMSEDIRLPMDPELFGRMMDKLNLWSRFRRMGSENRGAFSREVGERIAKLSFKEYDTEPRELLSKIFKDIAYSSSAISRIYASTDKQEQFRNELLQLAGEPIYNSEGEEQILTDEDYEDIENNWENILFAFKPLHSLFSSSNLDGGKRQPMGGDKGFLNEVFQVRGKNPTKPAPYVIVDMSPNIKLHAKAGLAKNDNSLAMQKVLDNADIKALMLQMILAEMKKASEVAFASGGGGNLNTQIVFDEAWRFAPEGRNTPEIEELANMLEGFALDTRKFGIGWTYILQSPADIKTGIWKQVSFVFSAYGLVGEDVRKLESLTDDVAQVDLYRQFISPAATGDYPFMVMGPISPLIFSTSPTFFNAFNTVEGFLEANKGWIQAIVKRRGMSNITTEYMLSSLEKKQPNNAISEDKEFSVGKDASKPSVEPQTTVKKPVKPVKKDDDGVLPSLPF